jgi:hypothetical protein
LRKFTITFLAGINRFVTIAEDGDAGSTFLGGGVYRFEKDLKSEFFILFHHFGETRFINCEPFLPPSFFEFFLSSHLKRSSRLKIKRLSKQIIQLLIDFGYLSVLNNIMLHEFAFPLREHLILNIHEVTDYRPYRIFHPSE